MIQAEFNVPIKSTKMKRHLFYCFMISLSGLATAASAQSPVSDQEMNRWVQQRSWANGITPRPHASVNADSFYVAYHRNPELWAAAFAFLKRTDLDTLMPGKYPIVGEAVFAMITDAPSHNREDVKWESHKNYIDLQMVIRGKEQIGIADTAHATIVKPYSPDLINYSAEGRYYIAEPGTFFLFFPNNAHRPTIKEPGYDVVKKIVIKIQTAKAG